LFEQEQLVTWEFCFGFRSQHIVTKCLNHSGPTPWSPGGLIAGASGLLLSYVLYTDWGKRTVSWRQGSYRPGKTGKSPGICVVGERSEKMLFLKSQGKWSWIMQTADIC